MITLFKTTDGWMANMSRAANANEVYGLFGTCTLPTAFTAAAPASEVLAEIQRLNPDEMVEVTR